MADEVDIATDEFERGMSREVARIRERAGKIPEGEAGDCDLCGEHSLRLVNGVCARCRDLRKLP